MPQPLLNIRCKNPITASEHLTPIRPVPHVPLASGAAEPGTSRLRIHTIPGMEGAATAWSKSERVASRTLRPPDGRRLECLHVFTTNEALASETVAHIYRLTIYGLQKGRMRRKP